MKRIEGYREFCNKLWNTVKFSLYNIPDDYSYDVNNYKYENLNFLNKWIISRLNEAIRGVNKCFDDYEFGDATIKFHNFWKYSLCDIYLEAIKPVMY